MLIWLATAVFLVAMNTLCFVVWAIDKERARRQAWRVREKDMLALAACGGMAGALIGQFYFRHKLRKRRFVNALYMIALLQAYGVGWLIGHY